MPDFESLSREELIQLVRSLYQQSEQIPVLIARIKALEEELAKLRPNPPGSGSAVANPVVPGWVKANRKSGDKGPRKHRCQAFVRRSDIATRTQIHAYDRCPDCDRTLSEGSVHHTRQVIDVPVAPVEVVEHQYLDRYCGACKKYVRPPVQTGDKAVGRHRIGIGVMSQIGYLHTVGRMSHRQIVDWFQSNHGLKLSIGAISLILQKIADIGKETYRSLLEEVRNHPVVHADETGWREDGENGYVWSVSTPTTRVFHRDASRGSRVIKQLLGDDFKGVLVSDFYGGYRWYLGEHQWCWVHYLRDLKDIASKHAADTKVLSWIARIKALYSRAKRFTSDDIKQRRKARSRFQNDLDALCARWAGTDCPQRLLAERGRNFLPGMFTFVEYPDVPSHNNPAERAVRSCVISRKVCGGTRSKKGSETMAILHTLFSTWKLRGKDVITSCRTLLARYAADPQLSTP